MKSWKVFLQHILAKRGIYVTRKFHPNDFTITKRINRALIQDAGGVLHIGAHLGQEATYYDDCDVPVLWFEASPEIYPKLLVNIEKFKNQKAVLQLLGDKNDDRVTFKIASNEGASSSIYDIANSDSVPFTLLRSIEVTMRRLDSMPEVDRIKKLRHWVIDVQGAEIAVLSGAGSLINHCNSILIEVKRTSTYKGGSTWNEVVHFLKKRGFIYLWEVNEEDEDNVLFIRVKERINN